MGNRLVVIPSTVNVLAIFVALCASLLAQGVPPKSVRPPFSGTASLGAIATGPNQINLTWPAAEAPGYGYIVEIQSSGD